MLKIIDLESLSLLNLVDGIWIHNSEECTEGVDLCHEISANYFHPWELQVSPRKVNVLCKAHNWLEFAFG